jgi:hypothetical protein
MTTSTIVTPEDRLALETVLDVIERERRNAESRRSDEVAASLRAIADDLAARWGLTHHLTEGRLLDEELRRVAAEALEPGR